MPTIRLRNKSKYDRVEFRITGAHGSYCGQLRTDGSIQKECDRPEPVQYSLRVIDGDGVEEKESTFTFWNDSSWEVLNWGVVNTDVKHSLLAQKRKNHEYQKGATFDWKQTCTSNEPMSDGRKTVITFRTSAIKTNNSGVEGMRIAWAKVIAETDKIETRKNSFPLKSGDLVGKKEYRLERTFTSLQSFSDDVKAITKRYEFNDSYAPQFTIGNLRLSRKPKSEEHIFPATKYSPISLAVMYQSTPNYQIPRLILECYDLCFVDRKNDEFQKGAMLDWKLKFTSKEPKSNGRKPLSSFGKGAEKTNNTGVERTRIAWARVTVQTDKIETPENSFPLKSDDRVGEKEYRLDRTFTGLQSLNDNVGAIRKRWESDDSDTKSVVMNYSSRSQVGFQDLEELKKDVFGRCDPRCDTNVIGGFRRQVSPLSKPWNTFLTATNNLQAWIQDATGTDGTKILTAVLQRIQKLLPSPRVNNFEYSSPSLLKVVQLLQWFRLPIGKIHSMLSANQLSVDLDVTLERVRAAWLTSKFHYPGDGLSHTEFWRYWGTLDGRHNLQFHYLETFLRLTVNSSTTIVDIVQFFWFCLYKAVPTSELHGILLKSGSTLNLSDWKRQYSIQCIYDRVLSAGVATSLRAQLLNMVDDSEEIQNDLSNILDYLEFLNILETVGDRERATEDLSQILTARKNYNLDKSEWSDAITQLLNGDSEHCISELKFRVKNKILTPSDGTDDGVDKKTVLTLVQEFSALNKGIGNATTMDTIHQLSAFVKEVKAESRNVAGWSQGKVRAFAISARDGTVHPNLVQLLAVVQKVMKEVKGYKLRNVAVMTLKLLYCHQGKGCLGKIATGEGKSALVAALAAVNVLSRESTDADIVTSSQVLAERDACEWRVFYERLGITVTHNSYSTVGELIACYAKDVVYGDALNFEGDVLSHEFSLRGTRGVRQFNTVIVDEVDSMFIDGSNHSTRLVDKMPQMDSLEPLLGLIWNCVCQHADAIADIGGDTFALGETVGGVGELPAAIFRFAPSQVLSQLNCSDYKIFWNKLSQFAHAMHEAEQKHMTKRNEVAQLLQDKGIAPYRFPHSVATLLSTNSLENAVDEFIRYRWDLSEPPSQISVLEDFLDIKILVYENVQEEIKLSPHFHKYDDEEESFQNTPTTVRLFSDKSEMCLLHPVENINRYIKKEVNKSVKEIVRHSKDISTPNSSPITVFIPHHLYDLFMTKLEEWTDSAIFAKMNYYVGRDYVIAPEVTNGKSVDRIAPVDYENTGVTQLNTSWGEGLHQFLQMKHKLKITPLHLTTNYISNLTFFNRYQTIYGVTGTLGDDNERSLLREMYQVDVLIVPTFKRKRMLELQGVVATEPNEWFDALHRSVQWEIGRVREDGRAVLVICKSITDVLNVRKYLETNVKSSPPYRPNFISYTRSDDKSAGSAIGSDLQPGDIVIATNLAGRGTDIKLSQQVIQNGGLHVITSFLPTNVRVEDQAAGRAARAGQPGTKQLILYAGTDLWTIQEKAGTLHIADIKRGREQLEAHRIHRIKTKLLKDLQMEEKQFRKYCELKNDMQPNRGKYFMDGVGERWAIELEKVKTKGQSINWPDVDRKFDVFFSNLRKAIAANTVLQNPTYNILQGNDYNKKKKYAKAIAEYSAAIALDGIYSQHAYYNRAYAIINQGDGSYQQRAVNDLEQAAKLIVDYHIPALMTLYLVVEGKQLEQSTDLSGAIPFKITAEDSQFTQQIINKLNFYCLQLKSVYDPVGVIANAKGDVKAGYDEIEAFYKKSGQDLDQGDIRDMQDGGFVRFINVTKKKVPWYTVVGVTVLAALQTAGGVVSCLIGLINVGATLIMEGVADFIVAMRAVCGGPFKWADYLKNKAISIGTSLLLHGIGAATKFIKALPRVASALNWLGKTTVVQKLISFGNSVKSMIKSGVAATQTLCSMVWRGVKVGSTKTWSL